jgi:hypothetical protein
MAANTLLKVIKTFLNWCVGRAVIDASPAEGVPLPGKEVARDRVLTNNELALVIRAARQIGGAYGGIVEMLALTGQRREEAAQMVWDENVRRSPTPPQSPPTRRAAGLASAQLNCEGHLELTQVGYTTKFQFLAERTQIPGGRRATLCWHQTVISPIDGRERKDRS